MNRRHPALIPNPFVEVPNEKRLAPHWPDLPPDPLSDTCGACGGSLSSDASDEDACDCEPDDSCELCHRVHCTDADDDLCKELELARADVERGGSGEL